MNTDTTQTFQGLGIAPRLMEILDKEGFKVPTPIQRQSIPIAIAGKDLIGIAQTGTGKTLAFGIPMLQRLVVTKSKGLILVPTRELAVQVNESLKTIGKHLKLKTAVIIGGESVFRQLSVLKQGPHIIIATPGRLIDILNERKNILEQTGILVLDEADRMLDMGFEPQLKRILPALPKQRQTMLFSATMDEQITKIAAAYLALPTRIEVAPAGTTVSAITQEIVVVHKEDKIEQLKKTLQEYKGSTLVFTRTKYTAKKLADVIRKAGHSAAEIHSNRSLNQRLEALNGFKLGKYRVLVATDIAARGIDVTNIELVINYDLPEQAADYVHRIGRTARAGKSGRAISFATSDQLSDIRAIERLIKKTLSVKKVAPLQQRVTVPAGKPIGIGANSKYSEVRFDRSGHARHRRPDRGPNRGPRRGGRNAGKKPFSRFKPNEYGPEPDRGVY